MTDIEPDDTARILGELADYAETLRTANVSCAGRFTRLQKAIAQAAHDVEG